MASLIITTGENAGVAFKLDRHPLVGGREANRDIQLMAPKVSRRHFVVHGRVAGRSEFVKKGTRI